ncbi:MAG: zinc ribbon domain-containing protein [Candidatus Methanoperedens sp.]|nr:zinc ribbon domain-containing protein [Candidatus Methanoperedens sp.]
MKKELLKPIINAIFALFLIILVKIVAMIMLKKVSGVNDLIDIALSLAVVVVLLTFMQEFNKQLEVSSPEFPQFRSIISWLIFLLIVLTFYGAFSPFFAGLPYGIYFIIFFILALVPVYFLWKILYRNMDKISSLLENISLEEKIRCSCGMENPESAKFCNSCGLPLQEKSK